MKIAMVLYKYFPFGGLQKDFKHFLQLLVEHGHEVTVYCRSWQDQGELDAIKSKFTLQLITVNAFSNHKKNQKFYSHLKQHLDANSFDVVFGFNKMPSLDLYFAADTCYATKINRQRPFLSKFIPRDRHFLKFETAVFSNQSNTKIFLISETEKQHFVDCYNTPNERLTMLPPGISLKKVPPDNVSEIRISTRNLLDLNESKVLLHIASAFSTKGLDRVITALASLPEEKKALCCLLVIGGDNKERYQKLAQNLGVAKQVKFLGSRDDVEKLLWSADLLVHPARTEAAGIVLLEAIVAGLPVITTENCGYANHIKQAEAGVVLQEPFEQARLDAALLTMFEEEKLKQWQQNALQYAKEAELFSMHEKGVEFLERHFSAKA